MLNHEESLDLVFRALGDRTRRALVERLVRGPASVSELAEPLTMSLAAVVQHLQVLEAAGIVPRRRGGAGLARAGHRRLAGEAGQGTQRRVAAVQPSAPSQDPPRLTCGRIGSRWSGPAAALRGNTRASPPAPHAKPWNVPRLGRTPTSTTGAEPPEGTAGHQYFQVVPVPRYCSTGIGSTPIRIRSV
nr:metalloregulator ArsR/SmtB family transcription factor [Amycolatopsis balhimycina]